MPRQNDQDRVWTLMERIGLCMMVTHEGDTDGLRARPMKAYPDHAEDAIYFLTDSRDRKDDEIAINDNVCLTFVASEGEIDGQVFVSVSGTANLVDDRDKIQQLWTTADRALWTDEDDPHLRVLKVRPAAAEFWEGPGRMIAATTMAATAGWPRAAGGNRKVRL